MNQDTSTADRYASASHSRNLTPHMDRCTDADVLLAAGIAGMDNPNHRAALALQRMLDGNMSSPLRGDDIAFTAFGPAGRQVAIPVVKAGKKAAGRVLDGVEHNGYPA